MKPLKNGSMVSTLQNGVLKRLKTSARANRFICAALFLRIELILKVEVFVLMLTPLDFILRLTEEPLLVLMSVFALITLILLARIFFSRGRIARKDVVKPLEMITEDKGLKLPEETIVAPEIYPVLVNGEVDMATHVLLKTAEVSTEIRPLLNSEEPDGCEYCSIFKDLGTIVCPNCGKPLNLPRAHEK